MAEAGQRIHHRSVAWYDNVHQQVPAIRRGRDIIHEQLVQAIVFMPVCQREIQRSLNLSTELLCLALSLLTLGHAGTRTSAERLCEIWVHE